MNLIKEKLRKKLLDIRLNFDKDQQKIQQKKIREKLFNFIVNSYSTDQIITGYYPIKNEVDLLETYKKLISKGYEIALPKVEASKILKFYLYGEPTKQGKYQIHEPSDLTQLVPDIIIVPGIGYDLNGNRLGYGKGYYDQTLDHLKQTKNIVTIAPCYDFQIIDHIPTLPHDQKIDILVTESNIYHI